MFPNNYDDFLNKLNYYEGIMQLAGIGLSNEIYNECCNTYEILKKIDELMKTYNLSYEEAIKKFNTLKVFI